MENTDSTEQKPSLSAAQRRAEMRRRKLLLNSEDRMNRIVGFSKHDTENNGASRRPTEPRLHLDLSRTETWSSSSASPRQSPFLPEAAGFGSRSLGATPERRGSPLPDYSELTGGTLEDNTGGLRLRPKGERPSDDLSGSTRQGLQKYISRFDEAIKLQDQLANEKAAQDGGSESEEFDPFRIFRLIGSVLLAIFVRVFVCKYLSVFAPFLTLELGYMGLSKYFPKVEKKTQTTMLTAALLLSGIPAEVINRSMDTYRRMGDVFADLCVYFFTFIISHEVLVFIGSETP